MAPLHHVLLTLLLAATRIGSPHAPSEIPDLARHPDATVEIVAHRGANHHAPENTLAAAAICADWGVDYVEVDVRTSRDGVMFIIHDSTLNRTTDGFGHVSGAASATIDLLDAGSWFAPEFTGQRVPRLERMLAWAKGRVKVYLDVKDAPVDRVLEAVSRAGMHDDVFFWFGDDEEALALRGMDPTIALKINARTPAELREARSRFDAQIIECGPDDLSPGFVRAAHDLGLRVMLYTREDDPAIFRRGLELGIDMVNLDHPDTFIRVESEFLESRQPAQLSF